MSRPVMPPAPRSRRPGIRSVSAQAVRVDAHSRPVEGVQRLCYAGNVVFADGGRVVLFGVDNLVVVQSGETTLVLPRDRAADLKTLLKSLGEAS